MKDSILNQLLIKVRDAEFIEQPFQHLFIRDFLPQETFEEITDDQVIRLPSQPSIEHLHSDLLAKEWNIQPHPGCAFSFEDYIILRRQRCNESQLKVCGDKAQNSLCEGAGLTYRLSPTASSYAQELVEIFNSSSMRSCLLEKFKINEDCTYDTGIQKYLDCYEISPHPDVREKALTFMLNLNPCINSNSANYHTHFMRFTPRYEYIYSFWDKCPEYQRCWVPWDWCDTTFRQVTNNTITIFSPTSRSLHAVKADYNDLPSQRTQLYGNIWYKTQKHRFKSVFSEIDLHSNHERSASRSDQKPNTSSNQANSFLMSNAIKTGLKNIKSLLK